MRSLAWEHLGVKNVLSPTLPSMLRPVFLAPVLPAAMVRLRGFVYCPRHRRLAVILGFPVVQKRSDHPQSFDFPFQPRLFLLFLSQYGVNIFHLGCPLQNVVLILETNRVR
jgi:hypothetical protein